MRLITKDKSLVGKDVVFVRADGTPAQGPVSDIRGYDERSGELVFWELRGRSKDVKPKLLLNGREPYNRLFIQRVFPVVMIEQN